MEDYSTWNILPPSHNLMFPLWNTCKINLSEIFWSPSSNIIFPYETHVRSLYLKHFDTPPPPLTILSPLPKHMQDQSTWNILAPSCNIRSLYETHAVSQYLKYFIPLLQYNVPQWNTCKITLPEILSSPAMFPYETQAKPPHLNYFVPPPDICPAMKHK